MTQPTDADAWPAIHCQPCRLGYPEACDGVAWPGETDYYFPARCES